MDKLPFKYYILDSEHNVVVTDMATWANWFAPKSRRVDTTDLPDGKRISTVFLGIDHNFLGNGPPILFETMVFPSDGDFSELDCKRYCTWGQAVAGHKAMVEEWTGRIDHEKD